VHRLYVVEFTLFPLILPGCDELKEDGLDLNSSRAIWALSHLSSNAAWRLVASLIGRNRMSA
jgi:hypothetical protein